MLCLCWGKKSNSSVAFKSRPTKKSRWSSAKRYINVFKICKTKYIVIYLQHALKTKVQIYHIQINMTTEKRRFEHKNRLMSKENAWITDTKPEFSTICRRFWVPTFPKTQWGTFSLQFLLDVKSPTKIRQHVKAASVWRDVQETCKMCMLMVVMCVFFLGGFSRWSQLLLTSSVSRR